LVPIHIKQLRNDFYLMGIYSNRTDIIYSTLSRHAYNLLPRKKHGPHMVRESLLAFSSSSRPHKEGEMYKYVSVPHKPVVGNDTVITKFIDLFLGYSIFRIKTNYGSFLFVPIQSKFPWGELGIWDQKVRCTRNLAYYIRRDLDIDHGNL